MYKQLRIIRMAATLLALQPCLGAALGDTALAQARGMADAQRSSEAESAGNAQAIRRGRARG